MSLSNFILNFFDVFEGYSIVYSTYSLGTINFIVSNFLSYMLYSLLIIFFFRSNIILNNNLFHLGVNVLVSIFSFIHNLVITYLQHVNTLFFI